VADAKREFTLDPDVGLEEKIEVFDDGSGERVFNGNDRSVCFSTEDRPEDLGRERARDKNCFWFDLESCLMAEGTKLSLNGDPHEKPRET
jgi:hypothetical protein